MRKEKTHIKIKNLFSYSSTDNQSNNNVNINFTLDDRQRYNELVYQHYCLQNLKFTPIEQSFKFQPEALEALRKHSFDDIVYTTNEEIAVINEHNDSINLEKIALKKKILQYLLLSCFCFYLPVTFHFKPTPCFTYMNSPDSDSGILRTLR